MYSPQHYTLQLRPSNSTTKIRENRRGKKKRKITYNLSKLIHIVQDSGIRRVRQLAIIRRRAKVQLAGGLRELIQLRLGGR